MHYLFALNPVANAPRSAWMKLVVGGFMWYLSLESNFFIELYFYSFIARVYHAFLVNDSCLPFCCWFWFFLQYWHSCLWSSFSKSQMIYVSGSLLNQNFSLMILTDFLQVQFCLSSVNWFFFCSPCVFLIRWNWVSELSLLKFLMSF